MTNENQCQFKDYCENNNELINENLIEFKKILNCEKLECEKCYYYNFNDSSFTCLLYYDPFEPPGIIYQTIGSQEIVAYVVRSRIKNTNQICPSEIIEIFHFTHIFTFSEFSDEELHHFRESILKLLYDSIDDLLNSDFEYTVFS